MAEGILTRSEKPPPEEAFPVGEGLTLSLREGFSFFPGEAENMENKIQKVFIFRP